jgi:RNA polymerase sigma-70 factor, ECF subfamily
MTEALSRTPGAEQREGGRPWPRTLVAIRAAGRPPVGMTRESAPTPEDDDTELIRRVAAKDRHAFEALYQRHAPRVQRYLYRLLSRPDVIEEVLDDVMLVVWQSAARFNHASRVSTWIYGIAHHKALKARARLAGRGTEVPVSDQEPLDTDGADVVTLRGELGRTVARGLAELSPEQRAVVELTFYHDRSYEEIARIMRSPVNTVKTRMFHARRRLAPILSALGLGASLRAKEARG